MIRTRAIFNCKAIRATNAMLLAGIFTGAISIPSLRAQTVPPVTPPAATPPAATSPAPATKPVVASPNRYMPNRVPKREAAFYGSVWGLDSLSVKAVESGELIRFSYRILDPEKAKSLNDKKFEPALIFPDGRIKLVIPSLENVGQLRQTNAAEAGRTYWMAFSNPGRKVKRGDRVDIAIGQFRAQGLVVE